MNKAIDTNLQRRQEDLAILIVTLGNALKVFKANEEVNILPFIRAKDKTAFLRKHTPDYKQRLHKLLQTLFWALPNESVFWPIETQARAAINNLMTDTRDLLEKISEDLSKNVKE